MKDRVSVWFEMAKEFRRKTPPRDHKTFTWLAARGWTISFCHAHTEPADEGFYFCFVVERATRKFPRRELKAELKAEGWDISDFVETT